MASTWSALKIELLETGANSGTWGTATNVNLGDAVLGEAITGQATVDFATDADVTITLTDSASTQAARNLRLNITESSTGVGSVRNLILGSGCQIEKFYLINNTGTGAKTVKNTSGTGISVPAGKATLVYNNGTNVVDAASYFTSLSVGSTLTVTGAGSIEGLTVGRGAGAVATNTAVGASALAANTTGAYNTAIGNSALIANTTASESVAIGYLSSGSKTTGDKTVSVGSESLRSNTTGSGNTALGQSALFSNTTASNNTAVGHQAGYSTQTSNANTLIGYQAGNLVTGISSTLVGASAGAQITTGAKNTIIGRYNGNENGLDIRTSSNYIVLSDGDANPRGYFDASGRWIVGGSNVNGRIQSLTPASYTESSFRADSATAASTNWNHFYGTSSSNSVANIIIYGNGNIQNANNSYGSLSDAKLKENIVDATPKLDKLLQVRIRNYNLKGAYEQHKQIGVVAQELETVFPSMIETIIDRDNDGSDLGTTTKSVKYSVFVPILIKAIQELKAEFDAYKASHP